MDQNTGSEKIDCKSEYSKRGIPAADKMRTEVFDACYRDTNKPINLPLMLPAKRFAGDAKSNTTLSSNDDIAELYMTARKSMGHVFAATGKRGSGFFIDKNGTFATDYHVVDGSDQFKVKTDDGFEHAATLLAADQKNDLALLQVQKLSVNEQFNAVTVKPFDPLSSGEYYLSCGFGAAQTLHCSPGKYKSMSAQKDLNFVDPPPYLDPDRQLVVLHQHSVPGDSGGLILSPRDGSASMLVGMSDATPKVPGTTTIGIPAQRILELQAELRRRSMSPIEKLFGLANR